MYSQEQAAAHIEACWNQVIAALVAAYADYNAITGAGAYALSEDDTGMRDATSRELFAWCNDCEARLALDVDAFRYAIHCYADARDSETARSIVAEAFGSDASLTYHDPRGAYVAGAEIERPNGSDFRPIGLYLTEEGQWEIADAGPEEGEPEYQSVCNGEGVIDRAEVIAWLRETFSKAR